MPKANPQIFNSIDEFRDAVKAADADVNLDPPCELVRASFDTEVKTDGETRTLGFTISTASVDRMGDTIAVDGWKLDQFRKNPVVLWAHDASMLPIAKASQVWIEGDKLKANAEFTPPGLAMFNDTVFEMYKGGFLNATSVGFLPTKYAFTDDPQRRFGIDFLEQELLEFSAVPVPANAEALMEGRAAGIDLAPMLAWAEKIVARVCRDGPSWKCSAARNLSIDESDSWDGPAASKRMLDDAGFDGDNPDASKARRGFLAWDSGNPTLRGSYKLPFADIVAGKLEAVAGGIRAAASRLPQTDIPQDCKDEARGVLDAYEARMNGGKSALRAAIKLVSERATLDQIVELAKDVQGSSSDLVSLAWAKRILEEAGEIVLSAERRKHIAELELAATRLRSRQRRMRDQELIRARA